MDKIDVLCGADTPTLSRRVEVAFSIPIFPGGIGALVRSEGRSGSIGESRAYTVMAGTTAEEWLNDNIRTLNGAATVTPVHDYELGVRALLEGKSDVLFGERAILINAARRSSPSHNLTVVDRYFTYEPLALTIAKGDEKLRLLIDQSLSHAYRNGEIFGLYSAIFGEPDENTRTFFRWSAIPD
jgi:polar amino acid transport system substrate-binding protein